MQDTHPQNPVRAMSVAIIAAAIIASGMMFVPVTALEGLADLTGLSEIIPAIGAPLGDFGRAAIAYLTGAVTLCGLAVLVLRQSRHGSDAGQQSALPARDGARRRDIIAYLCTKMPWQKEPHDNHTLTDLNPFKVAEAHPDPTAPRLLFASQDLPAMGIFELVSDAVDLPADIVEPVSGMASVPTGAPGIAAEQSTSAMVAQLEAAVTMRQQRLDMSADTRSYGPTEAPEARHEGLPDPQVCDLTGVDTHEIRRPVLELVSSASVQNDDADSALAAALATLQRMTANAR